MKTSFEAGTLNGLLRLGVCAILAGGAAVTTMKPLGDFGSFFEAGRAVVHGLNPYGIYPLTGSVEVPGFFFLDNPNLDPPAALPVFALAARYDPFVARNVWIFLSMALYLVIFLLLDRVYPARYPLRRAAWVFTLNSYWQTLVLGQIYTLLTLLIVGAWLLLERNRPVLAGILIGIVAAVKPSFLVWPVLLLCAGNLAPALSAFASFLGLGALPVALYGPQVYPEWLTAIQGDPTRIAFPTNVSFAGLTAHAGEPWLGHAVAFLMLAILALWAWKCRPCRLDLNGVALVSAVLASPISWNTYTLFLLPIFFARRWSRLLCTAAVLLMLPEAADQPLWRLSHPGLLFVGLQYCLAVLLVAAEFVPLVVSGLKSQIHTSRQTGVILGGVAVGPADV